MISIQVLSHVDLKHGFVTRWENVLFALENMGTCIKMIDLENKSMNPFKKLLNNKSTDITIISINPFN